MSSVFFLVPAPAEAVPVISLAEAVPVPALGSAGRNNKVLAQLAQLALGSDALGSAELPTVGSAGHNEGNCKPCAFFHIKGCESGMKCAFCHLCPADEKRRRHKNRGLGCRRLELQKLGLQINQEQRQERL